MSARTIEEEMADVIKEYVDQQIAPLREELDQLELSCKTLEYLNRSPGLSHAELENFKNDVGKKFHVTAKLIESAMNALEKISAARKCEADIKGIAVLKGEQQP
jgi:hypothetical protein